MKYHSHAIPYRDSGALLGEGGGGGFPTEPGQSGLAIGSALAGVIQSFLRFALIPHLTKHAAVHVPVLCLSGHLDIHLVSRGACLSISLPDGLALITPVLRVTATSRQRRLCGRFGGFCGSLLSSARNKMLICETRRAENQISSGSVAQAATSSSLFCWQTKYGT